jgi:hypothetical protein
VWWKIVLPVSVALNFWLAIRLWLALADLDYLERKVRMLTAAFRMPSNSSLRPSERNPHEN